MEATAPIAVQGQEVKSGLQSLRADPGSARTMTDLAATATGSMQKAEEGLAANPTAPDTNIGRQPAAGGVTADFRAALPPLQTFAANKETLKVALPEAASAPLPQATPQVGVTMPAAMSAAVPAFPRMTVETPFGNRYGWAEDFNKQVTWLAANSLQSAELHLNPPQLGPLDVVISLNGDQASAVFSSPHAAVRDAVEQAMPKLREMMSDNGITLGNATVNDQARDHQQDSQARNPHGNVRSDDVSDKITAGNPQTETVTPPVRRHEGLLDTFA
jgi:flagellar hook-length control protein FliK